MYAGAPTGRATAMPLPPISVTWFPAPERSNHCEPVHESALWWAMRPAVMGGGVKKERMGPDEMGKDMIGSALVEIVIPLLPTVTAPMVRPVRVIVTAVLALSATVPVVMTMDVAVGAAALPVAPELTVTAGVDEAAKKPTG